MKTWMSMRERDTDQQTKTKQNTEQKRTETKNNI